MRQRWNRYILAALFCFAFLLPMTGSAYYEEGEETTEQRSITVQEWHDLTNDDAYSYRDSLEYREIEKPDPPPRTENAFLKAIDAIVNFFRTPGGKILLWGTLILIIFYAVYKIVIGDRSSLFGKQSKVQAAPENDELDIDDITETNWEGLVYKAAKEGDLRLAVRYSYLMLLQILQEGELIHYRTDKTNFQYAGELSDTPYKQQFRQLTRQYEYTWYGEFPITEEAYQAHISNLLTLKKQVGA